MKFYLGVTDNEWFDFLAQRENEDINFRQPGGNTSFKVLDAGEPFLFKLKSPRNAIGGIGFFSSHTFLPIEMAWNIFGERNGLSSFFAFKQKIDAYRRSKNSLKSNPQIGCIVLTDPIFFEKQDWIATPSNWKPSIVQGKSYDTNDVIAKALWKEVELRLAKYRLLEREESKESYLMVNEPSFAGYTKYLTKVRLGQGAFRVRITDAYQRKCSISGEKTLPVLEAAHIKPYAESGPHLVSNGLLLRADLHKLFDSGYLTVTPKYQVEVSSKIKEEFENGKEYYKYQGSNLILPNELGNKPKAEFIDWHNNNLYKG